MDPKMHNGKVYLSDKSSFESDGVAWVQTELYSFDAVPMPWSGSKGETFELLNPTTNPALGIVKAGFIISNNGE